MAGINAVIDPILGELVCGPEEGQNTTVDGFQVNVIGDTGSGLYNAGDGIDIEGSTINVTLTAGYRCAVSGSTVGFDPTGDIVTVAGASVTLQPDTAYKIYATASAVTLNANVPAAGKWAYEGHLEIFVAGTGYIVTGTNVVLANALEPDSVNNCTVRFHDGLAIISVEDHIAGYVVVSATGTTAGTLPYALTSATQEYVAFDASLNGATVSLSGSTANGEKHLVGNGYAETTLTGAVNCGTSKFTVANLGLNNVQVNGGVMTLGDAFIPSGSTVSVSGGGLAVEKVTGAGNGGVIDLGYNSATQTGGTHIDVPRNKKAFFAGCSLVNGNEDFGGALSTIGDVNFSNCVITSNHARVGAGLYCASATIIDMRDSIISGNSLKSGSDSRGSGAYINLSATLNLHGGCVVDEVMLAAGANLSLASSNVVSKVVYYDTGGTVTLTSGATLDLTGNTNSTPIAPRGGIAFEAGGATVYPSAGQASAYELGGVTCVDLTNTNTVHTSGALGTFGAGGMFLRNVRIIPDAYRQINAMGLTTIENVNLDGFTIINDGRGVELLKISGDNFNVRPQFTSSGAIQIASNTVLRTNAVAPYIYCTTNGTLTVGANCAIVVDGTTASINGGTAGTFENSHINGDGTIVPNE